MTVKEKSPRLCMLGGFLLLLIWLPYFSNVISLSTKSIPSEIHDTFNENLYGKPEAVATEVDRRVAVYERDYRIKWVASLIISLVAVASSILYFISNNKAGLVMLISFGLLLIEYIIKLSNLYVPHNGEIFSPIITQLKAIESVWQTKGLLSAALLSWNEIVFPVIGFLFIMWYFIASRVDAKK